MEVGGGCCLGWEPRLQRVQSGRRGRNRLVAVGRLAVAVVVVVVVGIPVDVVDAATVVLPVYVVLLVLLVFLVCVVQIRLCLVPRGRLRRTWTRARGRPER